MQATKGKTLVYHNFIVLTQNFNERKGKRKMNEPFQGTNACTNQLVNRSKDVRWYKSLEDKNG